VLSGLFCKVGHLLKLKNKIMKIKNPKILFPFFMALIMTFVISGSLLLINRGLIAGFFLMWMKSFLMVFLIAFPTAFFVAPLVQKIVKFICEKK